MARFRALESHPDFVLPRRLDLADSNEEVLFEEDDVKVTQYRLVVGNATYLMQNITSIRHDIEQPPIQEDNYYKFFGWAGAAMLFLFLFVIIASCDNTENELVVTSNWGVAIAVLLLLIGSGCLWFAMQGPMYNDRLPEWMRHYPPPAPPAIHTITLTSAAHEQEALSSTDEEYVRDVLAALNRGIALK